MRAFRLLSRLAVAMGLAATLAAQAQPAAAQDGMSLIRDTEIEEILHKDADPILRAAGFDPTHVQILLIGSKDLNAFAAPKTMGVFTGLIMESDNPNQLQGVLGHEV